MTDWKTDDWENDDWETSAIPDLMISIESKEREAKVLKERKMMEEADAVLTEDLFSNEERVDNKERKEKVYKFKSPIKKDKPKELLEQRKQQLKEKQKLESQNLRDQIAKKMRSKEVYGEAEADVDMLEDTYGKIENKY